MGAVPSEPIEISALPRDVDEKDAFTLWVLEHCKRDSSVLEIGAAEGMHTFAGRIQTSVRRLVGVDPDPRIHRNPYLHERHQVQVEEYAVQCDEKYDCIYAFYVIEHIRAPLGFLLAARRLLKPGGSFFAATCNLNHYFGLAAKLTAECGIQDGLLRHLMGPELTATYHHRTWYRANSLALLSKLLRTTGFSHIEYRLYDNPTLTRPYFPGGMKWFPGFYSMAVYRFNRPRLMCTITLRAS